MLLIHSSPASIKLRHPQHTQTLHKYIMRHSIRLYAIGIPLDSRPVTAVFPLSPSPCSYAFALCDTPTPALHTRVAHWQVKHVSLAKIWVWQRHPFSDSPWAR